MYRILKITWFNIQRTFYWLTWDDLSLTSFEHYWSEIERCFWKNLK